MLGSVLLQAGFCAQVPSVLFASFARRALLW